MDKILIGHGSGGSLMHELIREHFGTAFDMKGFGDSAVIDFAEISELLTPNSEEYRLAFTTDSYVVSPIFFPGGNIGELAVYGTVNDLAVSGAAPVYLSAGFIIEEGFPMNDLKTIVSSMAEAAKKAGIKIVAGDTKVVNKGKADGIFINTAGIGILYEDINISPANIKHGDKVLINGGIGNHGMAVMAHRNGITFNPEIESDTAPLNGLVKSMLDITKDIRFMRDPTRGGLATTLKEAAIESGRCIHIKESSIPVAPQVRGACELLGFDPLYVANEGLLVAIVSPDAAGELVEAMRCHPLGKNSCIIGEVRKTPERTVLLETPIGGTRVVEMLQGDQLPRIC